MTQFSRAFLTGIAIVCAAAPGIGQPAAETAPAPTTAPKSLLPDEFEPASRPEVVAPLLLPSTDPATPTGPPPLLNPPAPTTEATATVDAAVASGAGTIASGRDISVIGPLKPAAGGYGMGTFSGSRGRFIASLLNRLNAPTGSRWASIVLARALLSESRVPAEINAGDWVASRAWALVRMGEIDGAKRLVDSVPVDRYTPALYRVAGQAALAAADIYGLCPIAANGRVLSKDPLWDLAIGMCAALQGDDITAADVFDRLEASEQVDPFDVRLGERVATIAGGAGRAAIIDWNEAPPLTPFRYAVATASGVPVPADKLAQLGPARAGWIVRNPGVEAEIRLDQLQAAAMLGTMSAGEITSSIGALATDDAADSRAGRLRTAFAGGSAADRRNAFKAIVSQFPVGDARYGDLLEAATAAARLPVGADSAEDSADIIAALLAAGDGRTALRWWPIADKASGAVRARAWAMLAAGTGGVPVTSGEFSDWRSATNASDHQAAMLLAALAGLGLADDMGSARRELLPDTANSWTRAISAAAAGGRSGEAIILAATGLQGQWADVPPLHLYHILAALSRVGRGAEARLIAAEAVTRS